MGRSKNKNICESLSKDKTYILVVDSENNEISYPLIDAIQHKTKCNNVHVDTVHKDDNIPNHDIYVMNINGLSYATQLDTMKTIYKANPRAALFLYGEEPENIVNSLKKDLQPFIDSTKMGEVIHGMSSNLDFDSIIDYILGIEKTKSKISSLWNKITEAEKLLDKTIQS